MPQQEGFRKADTGLMALVYRIRDYAEVTGKPVLTFERYTGKPYAFVRQDLYEKISQLHDKLASPNGFDTAALETIAKEIAEIGPAAVKSMQSMGMGSFRPGEYDEGVIIISRDGEKKAYVAGSHYKTAYNRAVSALAERRKQAREAEEKTKQEACYAHMLTEGQEKTGIRSIQRMEVPAPRASDSSIDPAAGSAQAKAPPEMPAAGVSLSFGEIEPPDHISERMSASGGNTFFPEGAAPPSDSTLSSCQQPNYDFNDRYFRILGTIAYIVGKKFQQLEDICEHDLQEELSHLDETVTQRLLNEDLTAIAEKHTLAPRYGLKLDLLKNDHSEIYDAELEKAIAELIKSGEINLEEIQEAGSFQARKEKEIGLMKTMFRSGYDSVGCVMDKIESGEIYSWLSGFVKYKEPILPPFEKDDRELLRSLIIPIMNEFERKYDDPGSSIEVQAFLMALHRLFLKKSNSMGLTRSAYNEMKAAYEGQMNAFKETVSNPRSKSGSRLEKVVNGDVLAILGISRDPILLNHD